MWISILSLAKLKKNNRCCGSPPVLFFIGDSLRCSVVFVDAHGVSLIPSALLSWSRSRA